MVKRIMILSFQLLATGLVFMMPYFLLAIMLCFLQEGLV